MLKIFLIILISSLAVFTFSFNRIEQNFFSSNEKNVKHDMVFNPEYKYFDNEYNLLYKVKAANVVFNELEQKWKNPFFTTIDTKTHKNNSLMIKADKAITNKGSTFKVIKFFNNVLVKSKNGKNTIEISSDNLNYDIDNHIIHTSENVIITHNNIITKADNAKFNIITREFNVYGNVNANYHK